MTIQKNTPTPWRIDPSGGRRIIETQDRKMIAEVISRRPETDADAELLVRAVNSHDHLIRALTMMVDEKCDYMRINHLGDPETQHTVKAARAALAKAGTP